MERVDRKETGGWRPRAAAQGYPFGSVGIHPAGRDRPVGSVPALERLAPSSRTRCSRPRQPPFTRRATPRANSIFAASGVVCISSAMTAKLAPSTPRRTKTSRMRCGSSVNITANRRLRARSASSWGSRRPSQRKTPHDGHGASPCVAGSMKAALPQRGQRSGRPSGVLEEISIRLVLCQPNGLPIQRHEGLRPRDLKPLFRSRRPATAQIIRQHRAPGG